MGIKKVRMNVKVQRRVGIRLEVGMGKRIAARMEVSWR